jgi:hypothetical protein
MFKLLAKKIKLINNLIDFIRKTISKYIKFIQLIYLTKKIFLKSKNLIFNKHIQLHVSLL